MSSVGYTREHDGMSVSEQVRAIREGIGSPVKVFRDRSSDGWSDGRKTIINLLRNVLSGGEIGWIVIATPDCLSPDDDLRTRYERSFYALGVRVMYADDTESSVEEDTPGFNILREGVAELSEVVRICSVQKGREALARRGLWPAGQPPYGYRRIINDEGEKDLAIDERKAKVVRRAYTIYLQDGASIAIVGRVLARAGHNFSRPRTHSILTEPLYGGTLRYGAIEADRPDLAIVDEEIRMEVEAKRRSNRREKQPAQPKSEPRVRGGGWRPTGATSTPKVRRGGRRVDVA